MEKASELTEFYSKDKLEGTNVEVAHVLPSAFPIPRKGVVNFVYCTDEEHPDGIIIYGGGEDEKSLSHQGLFDFAQDEFEILDEEAEGHWGGIIQMPSLKLMRESHGFDDEMDKELFDKFTDYLAEKYL